MPTKTRSIDNKFKAPCVPQKEVEGQRRLDPERRKKLEDIRAKELLKEKSEQLRHILAKKLTLKFGRIHEDIITNATIDAVKGTDKITSESLQELEQIIQSRIAERANNEYISNNKVTEEYPESHNKPESPATDIPDQPVLRKNSPSIAKGAEWQIIAAYDKLMAEDDARRQKDRQSKAKQDFRRTLDEHVQLSQELKKGGNRDEVEYSDHVNHDIENFRMEEAKKEAELKRRNLELLHIRKEQCEDQERHKRNEQTKSAEFARGMVQNAHEKLAVEKLIQEEARRRVREMRKKIEEDNVQNKKILQEVRIKEREEDQRLMAEYAAKLDKEAFERDHAFNIRMAHIDKSALQFALEGAGKVAQDEQRQREAMLMKELLQAEEREIAEIQRKDREKKLRLQKMLQGNQELIQSREQEKREEMQIRIRLAKQYKEEEDRVRQEEHEARQKRLIEQQKYNDRLHKQIVDRDSAKVQRDEMVGCERALNRAKLEKALANETVIQEVLNGKVANNNQPRSMGPL